MAKKSILYIITKSVWGGGNRYVFDLATALKKENHRVFIAAGGKERFYQEINKTDIPYFNINGFQRTVNSFKDIFAFFEILSLILQLKPEVIHTNSPKVGGIAGLAGWIYKFFSHQKTKLIYTPHGWAFSEDRPQWQISLIKLFSKLTCLFYDKIICVSEHDKRNALKNNIAPENKLITIHNGLRPVSFLEKKQAQEKLIQKTPPLVIGTIAEWTKNKGLFYLLKAIKEIDKEFELIMIGSGENPDKEKMHQYIKKNELKNVHLIEWIDNASQYLKAFDIFILPSIKEGLPYTILEASAAEIPIITTPIGGIPEIIKNNVNGLLVQPKNSQQLAEKIKYLINNPEKIKELTRKAKEKAEKEFSLEKTIEKTKGLYA